MSQYVFRRLKAGCPDIVCVELETPIMYATVAGNVDVRQAVDVHATLRTAAGPVSLSSPVQCLIVPGDLEEFRLGKDVLVALGIDVDRELGLLALQSKEEECDDFNAPEVSPRVELSDELSELIQAMVEKARVRGFPAEYLRELHRIATRFDLWRAQLGRAPPRTSSTNANSAETGGETLQVQGKEIPTGDPALHGGVQPKAGGAWIDL
ncbi:unnamed protein product [Phytophthora fragariaefolia]|uniref:Unnamed protein product n=1 Tax=Phytophthora fragariaefolia TaxID=1490495 RepID=A0A9W6Y0E0_9STRA|nr:unnamed protein product [Phytophthora fragariaefolia]